METPTTETYVYLLEMLPPSLNVWMRWSWRRQRNEQTVFQTALNAVLNEKGNRIPRGFEAVDIRYVLTFKARRGRDSDNFSTPLHKWTQDVLVWNHVIPDDTHDRCTSMRPKLERGIVDSTLVLIAPRERSEDETD